MRELDLLLEGFLTDRYETLSATDRTSFERLLDCRNEDLMAWLINGGSPEDERLAGIVDRIRRSVAIVRETRNGVRPISGAQN